MQITLIILYVLVAAYYYVVIGDDENTSTDYVARVVVAALWLPIMIVIKVSRMIRRFRRKYGKM